MTGYQHLSFALLLIALMFILASINIHVRQTNLLLEQLIQKQVTAVYFNGEPGKLK